MGVRGAGRGTGIRFARQHDVLPGARPVPPALRLPLLSEAAGIRLRAGDYECRASLSDLHTLPTEQHSKWEVINQVRSPKLERFKNAFSYLIDFSLNICIRGL